MIIFIENQKESTGNLLEIIELNKVDGFFFLDRSQLHFFTPATYTWKMSWKYQKISSKYSGINLIKDMQNIYGETLK